MSELTYKKIIDVETIETLSDAATVFINDDGVMKQVAADKFGTVKTVNGVEPDENGNIESYHSVSFNFADGSAIVPGLITYYGTETMAEICDYYAQSAVYNVECRRMIIGNNSPMRSRNCIGNEAIKDADGNIIGQRLFFGDDLCPVILDIASNKIIFDPDWVKPEENAGGSGGIPRLFVISEPLDEEPFMKMTPSMTYEELKALLEADNPPILVVKAIYEEEGVQDAALYVQNCSYFIGDGVIKMRADCEMRYTSDGTFEPVPV